MPIPVVVAAGIALGTALIGAGGTAVYKESKHKKSVADLQEQINKLQMKLDQSLIREQELLSQIKKFHIQLKEKQKEILELQQQIENYRIEMKKMIDNLKENDKRFRKIITLITLKMNNLKAENKLLREKIDTINNIIDEKTIQVAACNDNIIYLDEMKYKIKGALDANTNQIDEIRSQIKKLEMEV